MAKTVSILCVHGIGHGEANPGLQPSWTAAIHSSLKNWDPNISIVLDFLAYDDLFAHAPLNPVVYAAAVAKLLVSGVIHSVGDIFTKDRGLFEFPEQVRWTAGMIAQWATEDDLRQKTRDTVLKQLKSKSYDAVCAHSLGSLICYDTFKRIPEAISGRVFVSLGSQIGNPFVRDVFAGRIEPLDASMWYHLFNPDDHVLTTEINVHDNTFIEVATEFDIPNDPLNHDAAHYLCHENAVSTVWRTLSGVRMPRALTSGVEAFKNANAKPKRRALLIGINDYPDPRNQLDGCVNDVFLMSSILQESTFDPDEIRVVLDDRATSSAILDRLHWLLDDVRSGDERVLFYSGHGAQIPAYGLNDEPDHLSECLVPYDFDWTPEHAIRDKQFKEFYSQLPYDSHFAAIFDCCHSGGMTRNASHRVRGISPPDDIRHRALKWNPALQMWEERKFASPNPSLAASNDGERYLGRDGAAYRLGRAGALRTLPNAVYDKTRKVFGHHGPYLPVILEACQEDQLSYEYRHGVVSYGAYTYSLGQVLRSNRQTGKNLSFTDLSRATGEQLKKLRYDQSPSLVGPSTIIGAPIPWIRSQKGAEAKRKKGSRKRKGGRSVQEIER